MQRERLIGEEENLEVASPRLSPVVISEKQLPHRKWQRSISQCPPALRAWRACEESKALPGYGESEDHKTEASGKVCVRAGWSCIQQEYRSLTFLRCHFLETAPGGIETTTYIHLNKHRLPYSCLQLDVDKALFLDSSGLLS